MMLQLKVVRETIHHAIQKHEDFQVTIPSRERSHIPFKGSWVPNDFPLPGRWDM